MGSARSFAGDRDGIADIERSLELALAIDSPEAARSYNNLAASVGMMGDLKRSDELRRLAVEADRRYSGEAIARFAEGAVITGLYLVGRWDEFLQEAERFAATSERLGRSYQEMYHLAVRAIIAAARGSDAQAYEAATSAAEWAREMAEPQVVVPGLAAVAYTSFELGLIDRARDVLRELHERVPEHMLFDWVLAAITAAPDADSRRLVADTIARGTGSLLEQAISDFVEGRFVEAADTLAGGGWLTYAAMARSRAAEELAKTGRHSEADVQLRLVLPFWREAKATRFLERTESLLETTA